MKNKLLESGITYLIVLNGAVRTLDVFGRYRSSEPIDGSRLSNGVHLVANLIEIELIEISPDNWIENSDNVPEIYDDICNRRIVLANQVRSDSWKQYLDSARKVIWLCTIEEYDDITPEEFDDILKEYLSEPGKEYELEKIAMGLEAAVIQGYTLDAAIEFLKVHSRLKR